VPGGIGSRSSKPPPIGGPSFTGVSFT
jgi:hypothetical protein